MIILESSVACAGCVTGETAAGLCSIPALTISGMLQCIGSERTDCARARGLRSLLERAECTHFVLTPPGYCPQWPLRSAPGGRGRWSDAWGGAVRCRAHGGGG